MKASNKKIETHRGFKAIRQRIQQIENDLNENKKKDDLFKSESDCSESFESKSLNSFDSISLSSDSDDIILYKRRNNKHYSAKTLSFFTKSCSSSDDSSEKINKNEKKKTNRYHYAYKNRCSEFSADTATSDFDDLFSSYSYSSD